MKKILFLSPAYPYGHFGPSTLCSVKVMEALVATGRYEVHNISYAPDKSGSEHFKPVAGVDCHVLPFKERRIFRSHLLTRLQLLFSLYTYPFHHLRNDRKVLKACKKIVGGTHYDLVVSQYLPEESVLTGARLKELGLVDRLMVVFWDNVYGKMPRRIIPKSFAISRQRKAEQMIATHADMLISLYPIKAFHDEYGDVPAARNKRTYLGIPSIVEPKKREVSPKQSVIKAGKINMLYSGTIFRSEYVAYLTDLLNTTSMADQINLVFFSRGVSESDFERFRKTFKGSIESSDWIPVDHLLALYSKVDVFVSFPGNPRSVCSKVYEYMSYGKPLLLLYDDDSDVNVATFTRYPACLCVDERKDPGQNTLSVEEYIAKHKGTTVPFAEVERLFPTDMVAAYVKQIDKILHDSTDNKE